MLIRLLFYALFLLSSGFLFSETNLLLEYPQVNAGKKHQADFRIGFMKKAECPFGAQIGAAYRIPVDHFISFNLSADYYRGEKELTGIVNRYHSGSLYAVFRSLSPWYISPFFQPFIQAGAGYELMWHRSFSEEAVLSSDIYGDIGFITGIGVSAELGKRTNVYLNLDYLFSTLTKLNEGFEGTLKTDGIRLLIGTSFFL